LKEARLAINLLWFFGKAVKGQSMRVAGSVSIVVLLGAVVATCGVAAAQTSIAPQQAGERAQEVAGVSLDTPVEAAPEFEVATVKPSDPDACCARTWGRDGRHFATTNSNLRYLIQWAFNLQTKQVVGGPVWMDQDRFDIVGEIDGTQTPIDRQWKVAMQKLLVERFQIQSHHETREMSAYALIVAKGGPRLAKGDDDPEHLQRMGFSGGVGQTMYGNGVNASIADFIGELQRIVLDRPVVDRTGLTGKFNIQIEFTREDALSLGMTQLPDNAAPNLLDALQQQLGMKLEVVKAPVDVLVIDHAEQPSAN
jgi:uncharacterized protein (TIGR03435 family)